jgi:hypothetical protein
MPRKTKPAKKRPQKRKSPAYEGIKSMENTMQTTTQMIGNLAITSMGIGLAGAVIGGMSK